MSLIRISHTNKIPIFASDPDSVDRGAYATLAYDQESIGRDVAALAMDVLESESPGGIPAMIPTHLG